MPLSRHHHRHPSTSYPKRYIVPTYRFINIDHAGWELCTPRFDSRAELVEWFASNVDNPLVDVYAGETVEKDICGYQYM